MTNPPINPPAARRRSRLFPALLILLGLAGTAAGAWITIDTLTFLSTAEQVTGTCHHVRRARRSDPSGGHSTTYYPSYRYTTPDGRQFTYRSDVGMSPSPHQVGDKVTLLYPPDDPTEVRVMALRTFWMPMGLLPTSLLVLIAGLWIALKRRPRRNAAEDDNRPPAT